MTKEKVKIYTDGACRGNPGPGGWGVKIEFAGAEKLLHGGERNTTNNRMELTAAIEGLKALNRKCEIILITDSKYVMQGLTQWMAGWKKNGWKTANRKPVKNVDLWKMLDQMVSEHNVEWQWVKGHSGHPGNEVADALANKGIDELSKDR